MNSCFLFGHATCPSSILPKICEAIENCYVNHGVTIFYVGNRGSFDSYAAKAVKQAKLRHKDIRLYLLLAYHPAERPVSLAEGFDGSYYPPLENVPRPYAIVQANRYMIQKAEAIICYVAHPGNARNLLDFAQRQQKSGLLITNVGGGCADKQDERGSP